MHSEAVVSYPQLLGLVLHCEAKSQPSVDLYKGHAKGDKILVQAPELMHPNPLVIQVGPQVLHEASVLYVAGADVQTYAKHGAPEVPVPWHGPSVAIYVGQVSDVPVKEAQAWGATHPLVPFHTQLATLVVEGYQFAQSAFDFAVVF